MKSLDDSCLKYMNKTLYVKTQGGWGWHYPENSGKEISNLDQLPIPSFSFHLLGFTEFENNKRRGGYGKIIDLECKYNNYILEFTTRHEGVFNFERDFPVCNLFICKQEDHENIEYPRKGIGGYGEIRNSERKL